MGGSRCAASSVLADQILDLEARQIVGELIAASELMVALEDRLSGAFQVDSKRQVPTLTTLAKELAEKIDTRRREIARDPQLAEPWKWNQRLRDIEANSEKLWLAYRRRLLDDANARFDGEGTPQ